MNIKLFLEAIIKFLCGVLIVGFLLFISAGTINYFELNPKIWTVY